MNIWLCRIVPILKIFIMKVYKLWSVSTTKKQFSKVHFDYRQILFSIILAIRIIIDETGALLLRAVYMHKYTPTHTNMLWYYKYRADHVMDMTESPQTNSDGTLVIYTGCHKKKFLTKNTYFERFRVMLGQKAREPH